MGALPANLIPAARWSVVAAAHPAQSGVGVVDVLAISEEGQQLRIGLPFEWPAHYEDRDLAAAGLTAAHHIYAALAERCLEQARTMAGLPPSP